MFGLMGVCNNQRIDDPSLRQHLFNALVLPVLSYGSELWGGFSPLFTTDQYYTSQPPAEKVHGMVLRWLTGISRSTHKRVLTQAAGQLPLGAHWLCRTSALWNRLSSMGPDRLAHLAFRENIDLYYSGAVCWASRAIGHFTSLGMVCTVMTCHPSIPLSQRRFSAAKPVTACNSANWASFQTCPRALPAHHVPGRTLYAFASWFLPLTRNMQVHHNIPARHWRRVLRFASGGFRLMAAQARWANSTVARCPCCGAAVEDEMHVVLECPEYAGVRSQHPALFAGVHDATSVTMRALFQASNFVPLSAFLRDCEACRLLRLEHG